MRLVEIEVQCFDLPDANWGGHSAIQLGVQRGKVVEQKITLPQETATFRIQLKVLNDESSERPNFGGEYAQGTPTERFFYLNWMAGMVGFRRIKVPLKDLTWEQIQSNQATIKVKCRFDNGDPVCATLKPTHYEWR